MLLESDQDRLDIIRSCDGKQVLVDGKLIWAIFDREYTPQEFGEQILDSTSPQLTLRSSDLPTVSWGNTPAVVDGVQYVVVESRPDGTGMTVLRLRRTQ